MDILIRPGAVEDAALIADISRQTFHDTFAEYNTKEDMEKFMQESFGVDKLMSEVSEQGNFFLLAFAGKELAGYAKLSTRTQLPELAGVSSIEICRIYASKAFIGKGIGAALIKACFSLAKEKDATTIWLGVWEQNHRAIQFYTKSGFEKFGEHDFALGNDVQIDWLMKKLL
jgi:ribosomal protein S18 acetylase RimI-like enzyme